MLPVLMRNCSKKLTLTNLALSVLLSSSFRFSRRAMLARFEKVCSSWSDHELLKTKLSLGFCQIFKLSFQPLNHTIWTIRVKFRQTICDSGVCLKASQNLTLVWSLRSLILIKTDLLTTKSSSTLSFITKCKKTTVRPRFLMKTLKNETNKTKQK